MDNKYLIKRRLSTKRWRENNPDKVKEYQKEYEQREEVKLYRKHYSKLKGAINARVWRDNNQEKARDSSLKYTYGVSIEEYNQLFVNQNGLCAICGQQENNGKNLCVDHCHLTGRIRGLLCRACNSGLGHFKDNKLNLLNSIKYLDSNK